MEPALHEQCAEEKMMTLTARALIKYSLLVLFFIHWPSAWSESKVGEIVEGRLVVLSPSIGEKKAVALPDGKWEITDIQKLPGRNSRHNAILLTNANQNHPVQSFAIIYSDGANYWNPRFYDIPQGVKFVSRHGTTHTQNKSYQTYFYDDVASIPRTGLGSWVNTLNQANRSLSTSPGLSVIRIIRNRDSLMILSWIDRNSVLQKQPSKFDAVAVLEKGVKQWNEDFLKVADASFYNNDWTLALPIYNNSDLLIKDSKLAKTEDSDSPPKPQTPNSASNQGGKVGAPSFFECATNPTKCRTKATTQPPQTAGGEALARQREELERLRAEEANATAKAEELAKQKAELERIRIEQEKEKVEAAALLKKQQEEIVRLREQRNEAKRQAELLERQKSDLEKLNTAKANQSKPASNPSAEIPANKKIAQVNANPRKALIIGNNTYKHVTKLNNAVADAEAIAAKLATLGYSITTSFNTSRSDMFRSLRNFANTVQGGDEVVFFYAGHGVELGGKNFLLPTDIKGDDAQQVEDDAIELQRVLNDMSENRAKFTLAIVDACRDNPFKSSGRAIGGRGLAPTTAATGQMVIFSAGAGQQALDKLNEKDKHPNGLFTRIFVEEMTQVGMPIDRVVKKVRRRVVELANSVGHQQVPAIYDQVIGDFFFVKVP
jgi:hypothetical protein